MEKRIKYFTYYGDSDRKAIRENSPAADRKTDYIIDALNRCGYSVDIISHSSVTTPGFYFKGRTKKERFNTFRFFGCFGKSKIKVLEVLGWCFLDAKFFLWCLFHLKKEEQIIVYHSLGYDSAFIKLARLKKLRIIGEIEEIYQDVHQPGATRAKNEYQFIEICDKYLFPNAILNERLNNNNRPYLVCHGIYKANEKVSEKYCDGKIHLLYSGTFDSVKGGAVASVRMAEYLPKNYHLHITGFGDETAVLLEMKRMKAVAKCEMTYHGYLDNEAFVKLMQSCSIGLCTQDPTSLLNLTSFPSKILNYIVNGLVVLSGRNRAIEESSISDVIYYYEDQSPKAMVDAVLLIDDIDPDKGKKRLKELDKGFIKSLRSLLDEDFCADK